MHSESHDLEVGESESRALPMITGTWDPAPPCHTRASFPHQKATSWLIILRIFMYLEDIYYSGDLFSKQMVKTKSKMEMTPLNIFDFSFSRPLGDACTVGKHHPHVRGTPVHYYTPPVCPGVLYMFVSTGIAFLELYVGKKQEIHFFFHYLSSLMAVQYKYRGEMG